MRWTAVIVAGVLLPHSVDADTVTQSGGTTAGPCSFKGNDLEVKEPTNLIVRLVNPPRTKVTLSLDRKGGFHQELVWDPALGDGLKHDVLLPQGTDYEVHAYADEDRIQTTQMVVRTTARFRPTEEAKSTATTGAAATGAATTGVATTGVVATTTSALTLTGEQTTVVIRSNISAAVDAKGTDLSFTKAKELLQEPPMLKLSCESGGTEMSAQYLDPKRLYAASVARGFLDTAAPAVVTDTLALLAEIAVERAKAGAFEIVKERFVGPICNKFRLGLIGLGGNERAFPRTCSMLESMRLEDLFSSGRNIVDAARDDIRLTLVPHLVAQARLPTAVRDLALVALDLGNKMLDGGGNELAEMDLLVTQLDRMFRRGVPGTIDGIKVAFIEAAKSELEAAKEEFIERVLLRVLPTDPGALVSSFVTHSLVEKDLATKLKLADFTACKRSKDTPSYFVAANKAECVKALKAHIVEVKEWLTEVRKLVSLDELVGLVESVREASRTNPTEVIETFATWLDAKEKAGELTGYLATVTDPLRRSCAVRVTIAIVKWCSGRDSCTAGRIATALDNPESLFKAPTGADVREKMCWDGIGTVAAKLRLPAERGRYVELATRALAFLTPPAKGEERARVQAVLHWMFDLAKTIDPAAEESVEKLEEILALFEKRDYVRAIAQAVTTAVELNGCTDESCRPEPFKKAMQLVGALASYLQVYDDTKAGDPAEAKAARKRAIESLIDGSTDRRGRGGKWIFSLGASVGVTGGSLWTPGTDPHGYPSTKFGDAYANDTALTWRLPLGIALQKIPAEGSIQGYHFAATFADLGNFVRNVGEDGDDEIEWDDFVQLGLQAGLTFGNRKHAFVLALDANWSPGTFERSVVIDKFGRHRLETLDGALMAGVTLAYYVPIFDLN